MTGEPRRVAFASINARAITLCEPILRQWLPDGRVVTGEYVVRNPKRYDRNAGSFRINLNTGQWADFATNDRGGDLVSLAAYLFDLSQSDAAVRLAQMIGISPYEQ